MPGTLRQIVLAVDDVDAAVRHYCGELGLSLQFQDGNRWAALKLGDLTLALAGPGEQPANAVSYTHLTLPTTERV